jgi:hypothetical protein
MLYQWVGISLSSRTTRVLLMCCLLCIVVLVVSGCARIMDQRWPQRVASTMIAPPAGRSNSGYGTLYAKNRRNVNPSVRVFLKMGIDWFSRYRTCTRTTIGSLQPCAAGAPPESLRRWPPWSAPGAPRHGPRAAISLSMVMVTSSVRFPGAASRVRLIEAAQQVMRSGQPRLLEFGVSDEQAWQVGLACGGRVQVFVEAVE